MITKVFILIIWFGGRGVATQEFNSLERCNIAGKAFEEESMGSDYLCVEK